MDDKTSNDETNTASPLAFLKRHEAMARETAAYELRYLARQARDLAADIESGGSPTGAGQPLGSARSAALAVERIRVPIARREGYEIDRGPS